MIYMRGLKNLELSEILNFLYYGDVKIWQDELDSFISMATELQIRGLVDREEEKNSKT